MSGGCLFVGVELLEDEFCEQIKKTAPTSK